VACLLVAACGGDDAPAKPTSVTAADLDKDGTFWRSLTPDLQDELVEAGKTKLGEARPDGATVIASYDTDELVSEIDKQYTNTSKRSASIYDTYVTANDTIARENLNEVMPQLEGGG
jgi:hypothetical protein